MKQKSTGEYKTKRTQKLQWTKWIKTPEGKRRIRPPFLDDPQSKNSYLHLLISKPRYRREKGKGEVRERESWHRMAAPSSLIFHQSSAERWFYPYTTNYAYYTLKSIYVQLFIEASDGHTAFMTPLRLDARFVMTSRVLCNHHPAARAPLVLRPKSVNLPPLAFEAQTGKPATSNVDACPTSRQVHQHEPFARPSRHTAIVTSHPTPAHHETRDISNTHNIVNHNIVPPLNLYIIFSSKSWHCEPWVIQFCE